MVELDLSDTCITRETLARVLIREISDGGPVSSSLAGFRMALTWRQLLPAYAKDLRAWNRRKERLPNLHGSARDQTWRLGKDPRASCP